MADIKIVTGMEGTEDFLVLVDGVEKGSMSRCKSGPGFFLQLRGVTWRNAPGARVQQEKDFVAHKWYAKTKGAAKKEIERCVANGALK